MLPAWIILVAVGVYLAAGVLAAFGVILPRLGAIDPAAATAPWTFRLMILPGLIALWPLIVRRAVGRSS